MDKVHLYSWHENIFFYITYNMQFFIHNGNTEFEHGSIHKLQTMNQQ